MLLLPNHEGRRAEQSERAKGEWGRGRDNKRSRNAFLTVCVQTTVNPLSCFELIGLVFWLVRLRADCLNGHHTNIISIISLETLTTREGWWGGGEIGDCVTQKWGEKWAASLSLHPLSYSALLFLPKFACQRAIRGGVGWIIHLLKHPLPVLCFGLVWAQLRAW